MHTNGNSLKVVACFYGQWRTADYTLPWLHKALSLVPNLAKVFCSTKRGNLYRNLSADHLANKPNKSSELKAKFHQYWPDGLIDVDNFIESRLDPSQGTWEYSRMFWSLNKVVHMYNRWAAQHGDADIILLMRLDSLVGPHVHNLHTWLRTEKVDLQTFYTCPGQFKFLYNEYGLALGDLMMAGHPYAVNAVIRATSEAFLRPHPNFMYFRHGPNTYLKNCLDKCSLSSKAIPLQIALVRPNADLSVPVFNSFEYHNKFWTNDHPGIPKHQ